MSNHFESVPGSLEVWIHGEDGVNATDEQWVIAIAEFYQAGVRCEGLLRVDVICVLLSMKEGRAIDLILGELNL